MHTTLTFDQMERRADRTLAVVLWAKNVKSTVLAAMWMAVLDQAVKALVRSFARNGDKVASLSDDQAKEIAKRFQAINSQLDFLLHRGTVMQRRSSFLFSASINGIEGSVEDLADIIEDLILSCNPKFRSLLVECVGALASTHSAEPVGRV
jgi:hypothetical protein